MHIAMGRPTDYTEELAKEICRRVAEGENINRISQEECSPAQSTIYRWMDEHEEFSENYAQARARRADSRSDRIDDYRRQVMTGEIPPDVARLAFDMEKWQAGKENPKKYGDKTLHSGPDGEAPAVFTLNIDRRDKDI